VYVNGQADSTLKPMAYRWELEDPENPESWNT
jgi:hypothetical protein